MPNLKLNKPTLQQQLDFLTGALTHVQMGHTVEVNEEHEQLLHEIAQNVAACKIMEEVQVRESKNLSIHIDNLHPVHQTHDGFFNTASGIKISLHNPTVDMISVYDISNGLSKICRFGGQIKEFYSVLEHSYLVYDLAPEHLKIAALLHDASEAYLGDVIKPLKNILGNSYADIEERFMKVICSRFKIEGWRMHEVKEFDRLALEIEHEYFFKGISDRFNQRIGHGQHINAFKKDFEYLINAHLMELKTETANG